MAGQRGNSVGTLHVIEENQTAQNTRTVNSFSGKTPVTYNAVIALRKEKNAVHPKQQKFKYSLHVECDVQNKKTP